MHTYQIVHPSELQSSKTIDRSNLYARHHTTQQRTHENYCLIYFPNAPRESLYHVYSSLGTVNTIIPYSIPYWCREPPNDGIRVSERSWSEGVPMLFVRANAVKLCLRGYRASLDLATNPQTLASRGWLCLENSSSCLTLFINLFLWIYFQSKKQKIIDNNKFIDWCSYPCGSRKYIV